MKTVIFYDWKPGFNKVKFNQLLRKTAGYSLSSAINAVEQLLRREPLEIAFNSDESAASLVKEASAVGAVGEVSNASLESATGDVFATISTNTANGGQ